VRNEEVLLRVNEQRNILHEIRKRKANWFGHILRRNCLLKQVIEGKIKGGVFFKLPGDAEGWYKNIRTPRHQVWVDAGNLEFDV
jgi:hypothetical protein